MEEADSVFRCITLEYHERLSNFPSMGRPGRVSGARELVVSGTPYIIPYRVRDEEVEILRVFHGARKWPRRLESEE